MIDFILSIIERYSSKINCWAWDKRWKVRKEITQTEWVKGFKEWKQKIEVTLKNPLMERYYKLPKQLQLKISFDNFVNNADLIELVVETMENIAIGRYEQKKKFY